MPTTRTKVKTVAPKLEKVRVRKKYVKTDSPTNKVKEVTNHKVNITSSTRHVLYKNHPKWMVAPEIVEELAKDGVAASIFQVSNALKMLSGQKPTHVVKSASGFEYTPIFRNDLSSRKTKRKDVHHRVANEFRFNPRGAMKGRACLLTSTNHKIKTAFFVPR